MRLAVFLLSLLSLATACGTLEPGRDRAQLNAAKRRWSAAGLASYEYIVERSCFCPALNPVRITVLAGQVVSRVDTVTGQAVPTSLAGSYPDVPGLFAVVEDGYDRADAINVSFDPALGYPTSVVIDYVKIAVDDELTLNAAGLKGR